MSAKVRVLQVVIVTVFSAGGSTQALAQWTATSMHPEGMVSSAAFGISGSHLFGRVKFDEIYHAGIWSATGTFVDLQPSGARNSIVVDAFGDHQVGIAIIESDQFSHASLWSGTSASWTSLNPEGSVNSHCRGVADSQQVGSAIFDSFQHAGLWSGTAASWTSLHPAGASESVANDTTGVWQVGYATFDEVMRASLWQGTAASRIDLHPAGSAGSCVLAISGATQAGWAIINGVSHAGIWTGSSESWVDLHPSAAEWSMVNDVFEAQQVGQAIVNGSYHASWWNGSAESWVDLSTFLAGSWRDTFATGIWSDGSTTRIAGYGFNFDTRRFEALLWTTSDSPACPADISGDGMIDLDDLAILLANFGVPESATREQGDLDGDGDIDLADLAEMVTHFDETCL